MPDPELEPRTDEGTPSSALRGPGEVSPEGPRRPVRGEEPGPEEEPRDVARGGTDDDGDEPGEEGSDSGDGGSDPADTLTLTLLGALAFFTVLAFTLYGSVLDLGFLGWDSYPLVWSGRCEGLGDVLGLFRTELMDGIYTDGRFFRPVTTLSFALNEAFSGLDARGYHLFDLGVLVTSSVLLVGLGRRMAVTPGTLAGAIAGLVFLLHPVQLALLPVPPRRADSLSLALLLACLIVQRDEDEPRSRAFPVGTALLAFAAAGAKETGTLVALLVPLWHLCRGQRLVHTLVSSLPVFAGVGAYLALRTSVLGELGGHAESGLEALRGLPELLGPYTERVIGTGSHGFGHAARSVVTVVAAVATAVAAVVAFVRPGHGEGVVTRRQRGALVLLAVWTLAQLALAGLAGRMHDWYALQLVAPFGLLLGLLFATGARLLRDGRLGLVPLLLPLPVALSLLAPLGTHRDRTLALWEEADDLTRRILDATLAAVDATPVAAGEAGQVVVVEGLVPVLPAEGLATIAILSDYSIDAWLELVRPDRDVDVLLAAPGLEPAPGPGELVVVLTGPRR